MERSAAPGGSVPPGALLCPVDQGLGLYLGEGWYRTTIKVSASAAKDIRLWFGGFDNNVDVYLNGQHLGEKTRGFLQPQEFENVGQYLKPGTNTIAVRVAAGGLSEIGTGGIFMPVMLYDATNLKLPEPPPPAAKKQGKAQPKAAPKRAPATRPATPDGRQYEM